MPQLTLNNGAATNAGIAASGTRSTVIIQANPPSSFRWCFGATYVDADAQNNPATEPLILNGTAAQQAISFSAALNVKLDISLV
jgi:hypothetical protein